MTDFTNVVVVLPVENIVLDDNTLFVSGIMHVACII